MLHSLKKALHNLFKRPQTLDYPANPIVKGENFRGLIGYSREDCIFCLKCEKACPPEAILFTPLPEEKKSQKKEKLYNYNPYLCIYCGECVRACPKPGEALWQSGDKPLVGTQADKINQKWEAVKSDYDNG